MTWKYWKERLCGIPVAHGRLLILTLTLAAGVWLLVPYITFQAFLSQGDHGRELYGAEAITRGEVPYRDFFWNYGPLPLYYYAGCFKLLGTSINAVLAGRVILNLLTGFFVFQSLALFVPLAFASLAAIWFWFFNPDFHFTYCYTSGFTVLMALVYALFLYIKTARMKYLGTALFCAFLMCFIKLNFGVTSLMSVVLSVFGIDLWRKTKLDPPKILFYAIALVGLPLVVLLIYAAMVKGLPWYAIQQCFPFLPRAAIGSATVVAAVTAPFGYSVTSGFVWWLQAQILNPIHSPKNLIMAFLLFLSVGLTAKWWWDKKADPSGREQSFLAFLILLCCYFLTLMEFFVSGVPYRAAWSQPFGFLLLFLFLGLGFRKVNILVRILFIVALCAMVFTQHVGYINKIANFKTSGKVFICDRGQIALANDPGWRRTVGLATQYLQTHLRDDETFFALPYDPLYYFLTHKPSPTRQYTLYIPYGNIPDEQEFAIINDLERQQVKYILISNRQKSSEGLGTFGIDYCPRLARYIAASFQEIAAFGNWDQPAEWVKGHAVKILRRLGD